MDGAQLRDLFQKILPSDLIEAHVAELGIQERVRKLDVNALLQEHRQNKILLPLPEDYHGQSSATLPFCTP